METNQGVILYIEQDEDDVSIINEALEELEVKHKLIVYPTLELAFQYLLVNIEKPFLIICDIDLKNNNHEKLSKLINSEPEFRRKYIPLVFFSSAVTESLVNSAYAGLNVQGFFQKSNSYDQIKSDLRSIIEYWERSFHPTVTI